ncbi:pentapeptide repeat-containing protein [Chamaesiphon minutus]|uniref:Putative low-complexity protein n=1 Tax=Chamaesiphon minutus (strain ATCC 27169 / PCC 6605) TaxID=1173020 RepID=K9UGD4_CHAP6|nr:pentapeptide repeat-containing protein [Chamaesiphon minutus]AFY93723.1 putative low-complexity protein [Chamaesiphon minutus PCC 6605]
MIWFNVLGAIAIGCGILFKNTGLTVAGCAISFGLSVPIIYRGIRPKIPRTLSSRQQLQIVTTITMLVVIINLLKFGGFFTYIGNLSAGTDWSAVGALGLWGGAIGQTIVATIAALVSWRQYIVSRDLTLEQNRLNHQQNVITQQQTIDNYFQGICDLVLDDNGFLEDWPQERAFAVGRTAALLGSVNAEGKARVLRFLSRSKLLTPLERDLRLGRVVLNGDGRYDEDRIAGVRVINLGVILAGTDLSKTDLPWTDLSDANLIRTNLSGCVLFKANLARAILYQAKLTNADIFGARFFYGDLESATPRARDRTPDYITGEFSGAVVEDVDFTNVRRMSEEQRYYCCAWCGEASRRTIPGGCKGIPNRLLSIDYSSSAQAFDDDYM